jgi:hypothetical protein
VRKKHNDKDKSTSSAAAATDHISNEDIESWAAMVAEEDPQESDEESWTFAEEDYLSDEDLYEALSEDSQDQAASASGDTEVELYDSGASRHITCYDHGLVDCHLCIPLLPL